MKLKLVLDLPPSVNALYTNQAYFDKRSRRYVPTGKRILSKEGREMKKLLRLQATTQSKKQDWDKEKLGENYVYMDMIVYFNRKGRDSDNINKALQDSLEGVIYNNDTQVLPRTQKVLIDRENPRVEVIFTPVEFKGIFDNSDEANEFVYKCMKCNRYRNGSCRIMQDSLEGVIRSEVEKKVCSEFRKKKS